jgi:hypothetical protein
VNGWRRRAAQEAEAKAQKALDRAVAVMQMYRRSGMDTVSIEDVLALLGAEPDAVPERPEPVRVPGADPLTGALWAGPPGSSPPG